MALMDYGRLRKYNQYQEYLAAKYGISIDTNATQSYHSAAQYAEKIHAALNSLCENNKDRNKVIRDMKGYAAINIIPDKYFDWMKSSRRAACYSFFWLVSNNVLFFSKLSDSSSTSIDGLFTLPPIIKDDALITQPTSQWDFDPPNHKTGENDVKSIQGLIADLNREKIMKDANAQAFISDGSMPVANDIVPDAASGVNFKLLTPLNDSKESYVFSCMAFVDNLALSVNDKIKCIDRLYNAWRDNFSTYPQPFSWIELDDEDNILWLWDYMRKSFIGCDVAPATSKQMKDFLLATFDNWIGWSEEQHAKINKEPYHFQPNAVLDKQQFLFRARNAWIQKRHREKNAKDTSGIKLTAQSKKKLLALQNATGIESGVLLKAYIDDAYKKMKSDKKD